MSDLPPGFLAENESNANNVSEDVSREKPVDTTPALPSADGTQNESDVLTATESKSKVSTCAELLAIEGNNKCFDCNTEVYLCLCYLL
jgi:hypothetical protein